MAARFARFRAIALTALAVGCVSTAFSLNHDAQFTSTPPVIDGTVDSAWSSASAAATGFVNPSNTAQPSTQQTSVRLLWDKTYLYVLFECTDDAISPAATANDTGFDLAGSPPQDAVEIDLDPANNFTTAMNARVYRLVADPAASNFTFTSCGYSDTASGWNLGTDSQTAFSSSGSNWTVEMRVKWTELYKVGGNTPGPVLGYPGNGGQWGLQLARYHSTGNNVNTSKWDSSSTGATLPNRPIGSVTFVGGPSPTKVDMTGKVPLYTTGFESPTFTSGGTINGVDNWAGVAGFPTADYTAGTTDVLVGSQSMNIARLNATNSSINTPLGANWATTSNGVVWAQFALKLNPEVNPTGIQYRLTMYVLADFQSPTAVDYCNSISFYSNPYQGSGQYGDNEMRVIEFAADGSGGTTKLFDGVLAKDWAYVTLKIDEVNKTMKIWYNGVEIIAPPYTTFAEWNMRFKDTRFVRFAGLRFYAAAFGTGTSYVDDLGFWTDPLPSAVENWMLYAK